ncbi:GGDEF domain-containing protein [Vibrio alginolyticus]|nr:GGDEF domain-containing protein [Vibrio alginolyticus]
MSKKSISQMVIVGNSIIAVTLILLFIMQHASIVLEQNDLDARLQARELTKATLAIQKMSDDMTNMTRSYVFTGDKKYKYILLNISYFLLPQNSWPVNYHSYLSQMEANPNYQPKSSDVFDIIKHFEDLGVNEYELNLLVETKGIGSDLYEFEMDVIKIYDSGGVSHAKSMVNSNFYLSSKRELSRKLSSLNSIINYRIELQSESKNYTQNILRISSCFLLLVLMVFFTVYYRKTKKLLSFNINSIESWSDKIAKGDYNLALNTKVLKEFVPITKSITSLSKNTSALVHQLQEIAEQDELTGMPNRRAAINFLKQKQKEVARYYSLCSIILIDIDYFKRINDTYGHPVGDEILINVGRLISKYSRDSDCAARLGGEEFMVIAPQTDLSSAYILANKLKSKVESYIHQCGQDQIKVTISSGVSTLVADGSVEQTYKQADDALYLAKKLGRNNVQIYSLSRDSDGAVSSTIEGIKTRE